MAFTWVFPRRSQDSGQQCNFPYVRIYLQFDVYPKHISMSLQALDSYLSIAPRKSHESDCVGAHIVILSKPLSPWAGQIITVCDRRRYQDPL